ncbi:MAG TPA: riboflavin synthase [Alphaproteobacteria bacterium]|nr:riboflavin synthase [Alphaproteobacteria bacterium]
MFTGIVTDIGRVRACVPANSSRDTRFEISTKLPLEEIAIGASICCSGACLTVVQKGQGWFAVDASAETLGKTTLGDWRTGFPINLERALRMGDELGGHIVSGHVDGTATVVERRPDNGSVRFVFQLDRDLGRYIAQKGSVALDGVSLTVNEVEDRSGRTRFGVNIIPHTQENTTFGTCQPGMRVNVEVDMLARYVSRLSQRS